jgi:hypothetical protein
MMSAFRSLLFVALSVGGAVQAAPSAAQTPDLCAAYQTAVAGTVAGPVPVVPDTLLTGWRVALSCLVPIVGGLNTGMKASTLAPAVRSRYLSSTGAIRAILTRISSVEEKNNSLPEDKRDPNVEKVADFVAEFHKHQTIDVTSVLAYGAHSKDFDMRVNAILILGNVVDETNVCVPLIHLYDPSLGVDENGVKGRANLLGVISVVAPWAYSEDFANMTRVRSFMQAKIARDDPNLTSTNRLLDNIDKRLASQTEKTNRSVHLPDKFREQCRNYLRAYPATPDMTANISY